MTTTPEVTPMSDHELVDVEHENGDTATVTASQARVLAKSGWSRTTTAGKSRRAPAKTTAPATNDPTED